MRPQNIVFSNMKKMKAYQVPFTGLKEGKHHFEFKIENSFFEYFGYEEFNTSVIVVNLVLNKKATMLELVFTATGNANVNCDRTNEPFDQKIEATLNLIVQFGAEFNNENEEILILPQGEFQIEVQQYIYEMIVLSIPVKLEHPGLIDGTLKTDMLAKIEEYSRKSKKEEQEIDPRWNKLKNLLTDK